MAHAPRPWPRKPLGEAGAGTPVGVGLAQPAPGPQVQGQGLGGPWRNPPAPSRRNPAGVLSAARRPTLEVLKPGRRGLRCAASRGQTRSWIDRSHLAPGPSARTLHAGALRQRSVQYTGLNAASCSFRRGGPALRRCRFLCVRAGPVSDCPGRPDRQERHAAADRDAARDDGGNWPEERPSYPP